MKQYTYQTGQMIYRILLQDGYDCEEYKVLLQNSTRNNINGVGLLFTGISEVSDIDCDQAFALDMERLCGVIFPLRMVRVCGWLNEQLGAGALLEFCVRLLLDAGRGLLIPAESATAQSERKPDDNVKVSADEMAHTYAYLMRYHLQTLHKRGKTDAVFGELCVFLQGKSLLELFQQYMHFFVSNVQEYERIAGYTAPFVILRGDDTCGGVLQQFADDLTEALAAQDQAVIEIGAEDTDYDALQGAVCKGVVGFQAAALEIDFFRKLHGPKFQFWFDNPLRFTGILRNLPEDHYVLCQDADHAELIRTYYHTPNAIQFPPGGMDPAEADMSYKASGRPYDVLFMGRYFPDAVEELTREQKSFYDYMVTHSELTFEQGLMEWDPAMPKAADEAFVARMQELKPACRTVIGYFRNKVLSTLLDAGVTVQVYGEEWKILQGRNPVYADRLIIHPEVSMAESAMEFQKAKIGLNVMSWYKAGMTERIANIMLSGAVCLSDETTYLQEHTTDGEDIVLYSLQTLDRLPRKVFSLLRDDEKRETIAQKGFEKARAEFSWSARAKQLIRLSESLLQKTDTLRIFVATHVPFDPPQEPIYVPLQVGRSGKPDLGYLGDHTGENISDLNFLYGELTGLYWIWQNVRDVDYVGLCHYRRYFIDETMQAMNQDTYLAYLREYDAIVPKHMQCEGGCTYRQQFGQAHNLHDLEAVGRALSRLYPEYEEAFEKAMNGTVFYYGNLVVTSRKILSAYAEWLFTIFVEAGEEIDVSGYDNYHKRVYGFLSEQMFYVFAMANRLKLREVSVGVSAEKAETKELKEMLRKLIAEDQIKEAKALLEQSLKARPDLLLPGSDVHHELRDLYDRICCS